MKTSVLHGLNQAGIGQLMINYRIHRRAWSESRYPLCKFLPLTSKVLFLDDFYDKFLWPPHGIGQAIIFLPCGFYLSLYLFSSPNLQQGGAVV